MKKTAVLLAMLLALISCEADHGHNFSSIANNSSYSVTVIDERNIQIIIPAGQSRSVERRGADTVKNNFFTEKPNRVQFAVDSFSEGQFVDTVSYKLSVLNLTSKELKITANNYIDTANEPLTISSGEAGATLYYIFTSSPVFSVKTTEGFDVSSSYNYDGATNTVRVTIP
ncbi:hypothetical protein AGMMS49587_14410 [Spirochaetia bacterium]|nr:hypothetical protein AGMMS49587_14410 [Spirochaetia bacterium]